MSKELRCWLERIDALSVRERGLMLVVTLIVLYAGWDYLLFVPLQQRVMNVRTQVEQTQARMAALNRQGRRILVQYQEDPDQTNREQVLRLRAEIAQLDARLKELTVALITPEGMAGVLERVLTQETDMSLVRLENEGAEPLLKGAFDRGAKAQGPKAADPGFMHVYRHGMMIEVQGGYLSTLKYLRALEALPWRFLWDALELRVEKYPTGKTSITVHTLGLQEGWIGV